MILVFLFYMGLRISKFAYMSVEFQLKMTFSLANLYLKKI